MWICKCGKKNVDSEDSCWSCGIDRAAAEQKKGIELQRTTEELAEQEPHKDYTSTYGTARMIARFISFVGWVLVGLSPLSCLLFLSPTIVSGRWSDLIQTKFLPILAGAIVGAIVVAIGGLFFVMTGQLTRAAVDTAENTGEMLFLMQQRRSK